MSTCCSTLTGQFDEAYVAKELTTRRRKGPGKTARKLVAAVASVRSRAGGSPGYGVTQESPALDGASALDVGAGFGDVLAGFFSLGLHEGIHVEASAPYSRAAHELAREGGYAGRVQFLVGDFVDLARASDPARIPEPESRFEGAGTVVELRGVDIVALDRVICCYPDMDSLLDASAARAADIYALSAPRSRWPVRAVIGVENLQRRLKKAAFRTVVHPWSEIHRRLTSSGFERVHDGGTLMWRIAVYRRRPASGR